MKNSCQGQPLADFDFNFSHGRRAGKLAFYCCNTGERWTPDVAESRGCGGAEEAVIWLSQLLSKRGWNVEVYAGCVDVESLHHAVCWKPLNAWDPSEPRDVVVVWRFPTLLKTNVNAPVVYLDLHEAIPLERLTGPIVDRITRIFVKSHFHRSLYSHITDRKFVILPNGIDASLFSVNTIRDRFLMINTAFPTRSLSALLDCYEEVKQAVPDAKLKWAYGWDIFEIQLGWKDGMQEWKRRIQERMQALGIEDLGRCSFANVAQLYLSANLFAYPTEAPEVDCISLSKAMAGGALPLTTNYGGMAEKTGHGGIFLPLLNADNIWTKIHSIEFSLQDRKLKQMWVQESVRLLKMPPSEEDRMPMRAWALSTYDWDHIANSWHAQAIIDLKHSSGNC